MKKLFHKQSNDDHNFWMSYTDLMSGFLVVFIILSAILYSHYKEQTLEAVIAENRYKEALRNLEQSKGSSDSLRIELLSLKHVIDSLRQNDLKNLILQYKDIFVYDPSVKVEFDTIRGSIILTNRNGGEDLFSKGKTYMKNELKVYIDKVGKRIVERTISLWRLNSYKNVELRIEGHTDPTWGTYLRGSNYSFIENLSLSSERANNVYQYILKNTGLTSGQQDFVKRNMISIGYSFSSRVSDGTINNVNKDADSRRIEFRIISK